MQANEGDLIRRAQAGDRQAFGALVQQHQRQVFSFVRRMCGNNDQALDITQDTFIKAWHALPDWQPEARLQTWLLRIARNTTIDALRRRQHMAEPLPEDHLLIASGPTPLRQLENSRCLTQLERLIAQLPTGQREVLLLRELDGLAYRDIATSLNISEGTVKSRLARAREALLEARAAMTGDSDD